MIYFVSSAIEFTAIILFIYLYTRKDKIIAWEDKQIAKAKRFIRRQLRKNERIVEWANEPAKHGKPDALFKVGQIKVYGDAWR